MLSARYGKALAAVGGAIAPIVALAFEDIAPHIPPELMPFLSALFAGLAAYSVPNRDDDGRNVADVADDLADIHWGIATDRAETPAPSPRQAAVVDGD
ncbi:MAG: hypothetical protein AAF899_17960 [Pseudomonadota bacterium]